MLISLIALSVLFVLSVWSIGDNPISPYLGLSASVVAYPIVDYGSTLVIIIGVIFGIFATSTLIVRDRNVS